jgi:2-methylisocitrate lyase-like PEP mutase family enzyme
MTGPETFDVILKRNEAIVATGAYDALSVRIAARAGARERSVQNHGPHGRHCDRRHG